MANKSLRLVNAALLLISIFMAGHLIYWWQLHRPHIVVGDFPPECGETRDSDAHYLALICQAVINAKGPLPTDPAQAGRIIADNAAKLGFTWPADYKINTAGEICDCAREPYQIFVSPDRVTVSSASLYGFYFANLSEPRTARIDK